MGIQPDDLVDAAAVCRVALEPFARRDWAVTAGELTWDVRTTVTHMIDALGWYAAHLAVQSPHRLRFDLRAHQDASHAELLEVLTAAGATLAHVARAAPPGARGYHSAGMADVSGFLAMGCDELLVHTWDAVTGLGGEFDGPQRIAEQVLRRLFPWTPTGAPSWPALLWANGRMDLPGHAPRLGPDWVWHCAPLDDWDADSAR